MTQIKEQIQAGRYEVDPVAVAEAMLVRFRSVSQARQERVSPLEREWLGQHRPQLEAGKMCSYPDKDSGPSMKLMPGAPSTTRPIQVMELPRLESSISVTDLAVDGTQAQSS